MGDNNRSFPHALSCDMLERRTYCLRDFLTIGHNFDIKYCFPDIHDTGDNVDQTVVAEGQIFEYALNSGFRFTFSDLSVYQRYESVSIGHAPLLILVVLEGRVNLKVGALQKELKSGSAVTMQLHPEYALQALHAPQQRLTTVALAFDPRGADVGSATSPTLHQLLARVQGPLHTWRLPTSYIESLSGDALLKSPNLHRLLILEGLALQLAGMGLPEDNLQLPGIAPVSNPQRERLELVRQRLEFAPHHKYSLSELAQAAAMSPSSLRTKFRATYGLSLFDYLRRCRLELARQYLNQGFSVQQTAHMVGYRHSTNFATAFRRQFGVSPKKQSMN